MKVEKQHEGTLIYGLEAKLRPNDPTRVVAFEVIKVKRRYAELKREDRKYTEDWDIELGVSASQVRAKYTRRAFTFFPSAEAIAEHLHRGQIRAEVRKGIRSLLDITQNLTDPAVDDLHDVLTKHGII